MLVCFGAKLVYVRQYKLASFRSGKCGIHNIQRLLVGWGREERAMGPENSLGLNFMASLSSLLPLATSL